MAHTETAGPMPAQHHSAVKKIPTGKALIVFLPWYAGPAISQAGTVSNDMISHLDWMPTLLAAAGVPDVTEKLLTGYKVGNKTYKVHLDGYNMLPLLTGQTKKIPRESFLYFNDDAQLTAMRYDNWKFVFMEQRSKGTLQVWAEPFTSTSAAADI